MTTEDPRASAPGVCGVVRSTGQVEWVCIAKAHDEAPRKGHGHRSAQPALRLGAEYPAKSERHYFVRRFPNASAGAA